MRPAFVGEGRIDLNGPSGGVVFVIRSQRKKETHTAMLDPGRILWSANKFASVGVAAADEPGCSESPGAATLCRGPERAKFRRAQAILSRKTD